MTTKIETFCLQSKPPNAFSNLRPAEAEQIMRDAHMPQLRRKARKAFAAACANLLNLYDMCGAVYGAVIVDRKFARMYVLSRRRIAVEFTNAGELVDLDLPVQGRFGLPYSRLREMDLYDALAQRLTDGELRSQPPEHRVFRWHFRGDQNVAPPEEDPTPSEEWGERRVTPDLDGLQSYIDFTAASITRLGAVRADVPVTDKLPTPVQDMWDAEIDHCLMVKGLPPELAMRIRYESMFPDGLERYLNFSAEEQKRRPESKGLWRRAVRRWRAGMDPRWDPASSVEESSDEENDGESDDGSDANTDVEGEPSADPEDPAASDDAGPPGSDASSEDDLGDGEDGGSDDAESVASGYSERTKQWITETGSIEGTDAARTDWQVFDPDDLGDRGNLRDATDSEAGYSVCSAEADYYEEYHKLENDTCFVLSTAEQILQEVCHVVPVTKEEMDGLVQTQYELDLERYK